MWRAFDQKRLDDAEGEESTQHFQTELSRTDLSESELLELMKHLSIKLRVQPVSWCKDFGEIGLQHILSRFTIFYFSK